MVVLPVLLADQALKVWIKTHCTIGQQFDLIPGLIELQFIENEGMAFGWALPGMAGKLALTLFRLVAAVGIGFYLRKLMREGAHAGLVTSIGFVWAGAIGNIIDSTLYGVLFSASTWGTFAELLPAEGGYATWLMGNVVDMFHFTVRWPHWMPVASLQGREIFPPIWNIADASISCSVIWMLIRQRTYFKPSAEEDTSATNHEGAPSR